MNPIERLQAEHSDPAAYAAAYVAHLVEVLRRINPGAVASFIRTLIEARDQRKQVFFIGNGGSAATASHFANDLAIGTRTWDLPFRVTSLTDNVPVMTAIANDYSYDEVFLRQLQVLCQPGDVVVAISASGNSPNLLSAVVWANEHGARTVGLTGFDGGKLASMVHLNLHVPTDKGEYGPVEDAHMVLDHLVGSFLSGLVANRSVST